MSATNRRGFFAILCGSLGIFQCSRSRPKPPRVAHRDPILIPSNLVFGGMPVKRFDVPPGCVGFRIRQRPTDFTIVTLRFRDRVERWYPLDYGDHWKLEVKQSVNHHLTV